MSSQSILAAPGTSLLPSFESWALDSEHSGSLLRLRKVLMTASGFRLILLEFNNPQYRDQIIQHTKGFLDKTGLLWLDDSVIDFDEFERRLGIVAGRYPVVHVLNLEWWLADSENRAERFKGFNYHREALAERCPFALLLWMVEPDIKAFALQAPDLWAWRTEVFDFSFRPIPVSAAHVSVPTVERDVTRGSASAQERRARIEEIEAYLARESRRDGSIARLLVERGQLYDDLGNLSAALDAFEQALEIFQELDDQRQTMLTQRLIADVVATRGNTEEARQRYEAILQQFEALEDVQEQAATLVKIANMYRLQGRYAEAEPLYQRALAIRERALGPDHPDVAHSLHGLAVLYHQQGRYAEAEPLYQRALAIRERALGPDHPDVAHSLNNLAILYGNQGRTAEAEPLDQRALAIRERALGPDHPDVADSLHGLAILYGNQGRTTEAEQLYQRVLAIYEHIPGFNHPDFALALENYALLLEWTGRTAEAAPLRERAKTIRASRAQANSQS
ncbi:MAG: tetratricopeptide repeat protein [Gammaproteobacteria bacterium]|nr:tetratricopeptide repeat protein [Gammaproteobacteria bacterium]